VAKIKNGDQFVNEAIRYPVYHDWKPMQSIIDVLYKISRRTMQIQGDFQDGF